MSASPIRFFNPFLSTKRKRYVEISLISSASYEAWHKEQSPEVQAQILDQGYEGKGGEILALRGTDGHVEQIIAGVSDAAPLVEGSKIYNAIKAVFSKDSIKKVSFSFADDDIEAAQAERLKIGWGLAAYKFDLYKESKDDKESAPLKLVLPSNAQKKRVLTYVESVCLVRDLVNTPANDMGPDELEVAARTLTKQHKTTLSVIKDNALLKKNFPMIFDVGKASVRRPRLLDFSWGNKKHPKVTLVGKGVCFDTGGLDIKPSQFMLTMKKDMGGAAHVLGLAHMVMSLNLPVRLRVLIPAVENAISGDAYRPSDVLQSRKGITVEVGNTDAEGRLVLADALTYACEESPDLLVDFATLTGAARIALGYDLPALFSNKDEAAQEIQALSATDDVNDPVWQLPLWQPYRKDMDSPIADISSTGKGRAGATNAALFLQEFIEPNIEWVHMDVYAWEQTGKPGRPVGGADTAMRALFSFLEQRYSA